MDVSNSENPRDLISQKDVEITLKSDQGVQASLDSFEIQDFTKKGDNNACVVTSILVKYTKNSRQYEISYVVKLNPLRKGVPEGVMKVVFDKEIGFFTEILPLLNEQLKASKEPPLRVPRYFHAARDVGREVIFMEDLRKAGYKMHERQKALDKNHTLLILRELGRLHASSLLLINTDLTEENKVEQFRKRFPFVQEAIDSAGDARGKIEKMFTMALVNTAELLAEIPNYDKISSVLKEKKREIFDDASKTDVATEPFIALCHSDCWNNNFLFRYSSKGLPLECRLVDFQAYKISSPGRDLNQLLYTSLDGPFRREALPTLLESYYATFASILSGPNQPMPFTLPQLKKEFLTQNSYGLLMATVVVPTILMKPEDAPDMADFAGDDMEKAVEEYGRVVRQRMMVSPSLRPRLLDALDEFKDNGVLGLSNIAGLVAKFTKK